MFEFNVKKDAVTYSLSELKRMRDEGVVPTETLDALRREADRMMAKPIPSVTRSRLKAPSGNPHDYTSMGTYWWPNPDTPSGLPYIRLDGKFNPDSQDSKIFTEMFNIVKWCTLAGFYLEEDKYTERALKALYDWYISPETYMTPHARYAQAIPGICEGRSIGLIDFRCSYEVMNSVRLLEAMGKIPDGYVKAIEKWYVDFTDWMLTSEIGLDEDIQHNNHGTWYDVQILAAAIFTDRPALAKKIITTAYPRRFTSQTRCDGSQPHELARTQAMLYSFVNHLAYVNIAIMSERLGDNRFFECDAAAQDALIKLAVDYLYPFVKNPDSFPYQQMHDMGKPTMAAYAYYAIKDRFPDTHCEQRFKELADSSMLFALIPAK